MDHLFVVDIVCDSEYATEKELAYNEIYKQKIEKQKIINPCKHSVYQLFEQ